MDIELPEDLYVREKYLKRLRYFYNDTEIIKVISGVRNCGKNSLMQMVIKELLDSGIPRDNILYFQLDKAPYHEICTPKQLDKIIEKYATADGLKYLFINELQKVKNFESVINAWREEGDISIFISSSSPYLLSGKLATKLTGRYIEIGMYPLTLEEYLNMKQFLGIRIADDAEELNNFIHDGGWPHALKLRTSEEKKSYAENLLNEILQKDISLGLRIRNRAAFDEIMRYLIAHFGVSTNLTDVVNSLNKRGIAVKIETARRYAEVLENAKILVRSARFDMHSRTFLIGDEKYYLSDFSLYFAACANESVDYGRALENIVHNYALTHGYKVGVGIFENYERGFFMRNKGNDCAYVQVGCENTENEIAKNLECMPPGLAEDEHCPCYVLTEAPNIPKRNGIIYANLMDFIKSETLF